MHKVSYTFSKYNVLHIHSDLYLYHVLVGVNVTNKIVTTLMPGHKISSMLI